MVKMRQFYVFYSYFFSRILFLIVLAAMAFLNGCDSENISQPAIPFEEQLQESLISANPGEIITIPEGVHNISRSLSLNVPGVTIRGEGMDKSILSYKNQIQGAEGLLVTADNFVIEDLAIEDTTGDAIKINNSENVTIRRVRTEWTGGPLTINGAYGIYPVQSKNI
jgi:parallel beta-helix repeat protein